jgi:hypothetical protein
MLQPPKDVPPEVDQELARFDQHALQKSTRVGLHAAVCSLLFFPLLYWMGFRQAWFHVAGVAICVAVVLSSRFLGRYSATLSGYVSILGNLGLFALLAWILTPALVGPGPAIMLVMLLVPYRLLRRPWPIALACALATLSPWWLQSVGMPSRMSLEGADVILHTAATNLDPAATFVALALYIGILIHMAAYYSRLADDDRREIRRTMQLQTWQLRQLMPRATTLPPV